MFMNIGFVTHYSRYFHHLHQEIIISEPKISLTPHLLYQSVQPSPSPMPLIRPHWLTIMEVCSSRIDILVALSSLPSSST